MNQHIRFDLDYILRHLPDFGPALLTAIEILVLSAILAFLWGIVLGIARLGRGPAFWAATGYIEVFRNTPLLIQI